MDKIIIRLHFIYKNMYYILHICNIIINILCCILNICNPPKSVTDMCQRHNLDTTSVHSTC